MQLYGIYRLTIHPFFFKWCSHYYLCTNLSYTSHLQLYTVYLSSTESREFLHLKSLLIYCFLTCSSFYSFFILDISFQSSQPSVVVCILGSYTAIWKGFFFYFFFLVMFILCTFQISVNVHGNSCYNTLDPCVAWELHNPMWFAV